MNCCTKFQLYSIGGCGWARVSRAKIPRTSILDDRIWSMSCCCWKVVIRMNCCTKFQLQQISGCSWIRVSRAKISGASILNDGFWAMSLCYWQVAISMNCCTKFWLHHTSHCPNLAHVISRPLALRDSENIFNVLQKIFSDSLEIFTNQKYFAAE